MSVLLFIAGLVVALPLGHVVVKWFLDTVRKISDVPTDRPGAGVPNWIVGLFERTFAFGVVFTNVEGVYAVLGAWMAAKLALNWQRPSYNKDDPNAEWQVRVYGISALMAGTLSLSLGAIGGAIARCGWG
jgi:hypothetical protein